MSDSGDERTNTALFGLPRSKVLRLAAWSEFVGALICAVLMLLNVEGQQMIFGIVTLMLLFGWLMLLLSYSREAVRERDRELKQGIASGEQDMV